MKDLIYAELLKAPARVQYLYTMAMMNQPVGMEVLNEAMAESPEYFPDELERRRKWDLVPQSVHDEYWAEREKLKAEVYKDMPESLGIIAWASSENKDDYNNWNAAWKKCYAIEKPMAEEIHKRYYGKYGIEFNGW